MSSLICLHASLAFMYLASQMLPAKNIAPRATVTASSEHSDPHAARFAVDGKVAAPLVKDDACQASAAGKKESLASLAFTSPKPAPTTEGMEI